MASTTICTSVPVKAQIQNGNVASQLRASRASAMSGCPVSARPVSLRSVRNASPVAIVASQEKNMIQRVGSGMAAFGLAASFALAPMDAAMAGEFDIINTPAPAAGVVDDASVLSKATSGALVKKLNNIEKTTGYKLDVVTVRKLVFEPDVFAFADQVIENWFPTAELGDKMGVLLVNTSGKEGALVGGPAFMSNINDSVLEGIVTENIAILTEEEKFNEAILSSVDRIQAALEGKDDISGPQRDAKKVGGNFKSKEETSKNRNKFAGVVVGLLVIATAVPMIQYYGYIGGGKN